MCRQYASNQLKAQQKLIHSFFSVHQQKLDPLLSTEAFKLTVHALSEFELFDYQMAQEVRTILPKEAAPEPMLPPAETSKPTLVLDMDETLIYSDWGTTCDAMNEYGVAPTQTLFYRGRAFGLFHRPGLTDFLTWAASLFELVVFTAADETYATKILDSIDPEGCITHRLFRHACRPFRRHPQIKDLGYLGRPLSRTLALDDRLVSFALHLPNYIPVPSFVGQADDVVLPSLRPLLGEMAGTDDIPERLGRLYKVEERVHNRTRCDNGLW